jgi:hypothetical protein
VSIRVGVILVPGFSLFLFKIGRIRFIWLQVLVLSLVLAKTMCFKRVYFYVRLRLISFFVFAYFTKTQLGVITPERLNE